MKRKKALMLSILAIAGIASSITFSAKGMSKVSNMPMPYIKYWSGTKLTHSKREYLKKMKRKGLKLSKKEAEELEEAIQNESIPLEAFTNVVNLVEPLGDMYQ